jgi:hypothetical protein
MRRNAWASVFGARHSDATIGRGKTRDDTAAARRLTMHREEIA